MRATSLAFALTQALALSGCVALLCGPTVYHLSGVTAYTSFGAPWDAATAEAGLRALGAQLGMPTECSAQGSVNGTNIEANGCTPGRVDLRISYEVRPAVQGERDDVEKEGDALIETRRSEVDTMVSDFAAATGWSPQGPPDWQKGLLHGDC